MSYTPHNTEIKDLPDGNQLEEYILKILKQQLGENYNGEKPQGFNSKTDFIMDQYKQKDLAREKEADQKNQQLYDESRALRYPKMGKDTSIIRGEADILAGFGKHKSIPEEEFIKEAYEIAENFNPSKHYSYLAAEIIRIGKKFASLQATIGATPSTQVPKDEPIYNYEYKENGK